jgi:hypothetical protein
MLVVGGVLFWFSQPLWVWSVAPHLQWPPPPAGELRKGGITVFLLLDEMNAQLAPAFVDLLRDEGLQVAERKMRPVGPNTINVIPEMFSGRHFAHPKPCWTTAICSDGNVLDFSRIMASRDDIDVVGFYHPYCAIKGLRNCWGLQTPLLETLRSGELQRWQCAIIERLRLDRAWREEACDLERLRSWQQRTSEMLAAVWRMPVWTQGGLLYAHLPLPHPPGRTPNGSLESHYRENTLRALELVREMAQRARASGREFHLAIFSDHPIRQKIWCSNFAYATTGCKVKPALEDDAVPLIVAGSRQSELPDLSAYEDNGRIFNLLPEWR